MNDLEDFVTPTPPLSLAERGDVSGGVESDVGTTHTDYFCGVDGAHHLAAAGGNAGAQQQTIEVHPLIAQRITLVDTDHHSRQASDIRLVGKPRPGERIAGVERLDAIADGAIIVVQVEQQAVVLDRRRTIGRRPLPRDIGTYGVEALDEADVAIPLQLHAGGEGEIPPAALASEDDPG